MHSQQYLVHLELAECFKPTTASALSAYFNVPTLITGLILAVGIGIVIIGGIKRIGQVAGKIVPAMCIVYIIGALIICAMNVHLLPDVFNLILTDAFSGNAVAGGAIGTVIIWGIRRAVFSNEAGLGSASIAHAAVKKPITPLEKVLLHQLAHLLIRSSFVQPLQSLLF